MVSWARICLQELAISRELCPNLCGVGPKLSGFLRAGERWIEMWDSKKQRGLPGGACGEASGQRWCLDRVGNGGWDFGAL